MENRLIGYAFIIIVCLVCAAALYGCSRASTDYYIFANNCVKGGGSWVPNGNTGSYSGICIAGKDAK